MHILSTHFKGKKIPTKCNSKNFALFAHLYIRWLVGWLDGLLAFVFYCYVMMSTTAVHPCGLYEWKSTVERHHFYPHLWPFIYPSIKRFSFQPKQTKPFNNKWGDLSNENNIITFTCWIYPKVKWTRKFTLAIAAAAATPLQHFFYSISPLHTFLCYVHLP